MTERVFKSMVIQCTILSIRRRSNPGFPDLFMAKGSRAIAAELKSDTGKLTGEQNEWLYALKCTAVEVYCWRPGDWDSIKRILEATT